MLRIATLETPRLLLRPPHRSDLDEFVALGGDPEVMRYIGTGAPQTVDEAALWLDGLLREEPSDPPGLPGWLVVKSKEGGDWIGLAVLKRMGERHEKALGEGPLVEVGYRIARAHWGRGYATEAAASLVRHGLQTLQLQAVAGIADARNVASNRVLQKAGLVYRRAYSLDDRDIHFHLVQRGGFPPGG
jgi:RimJ/RimL family protein N-acetyltransferase